jgi:DNA-directed RNA polymerase specialized sigma24 family protein
VTQSDEARLAELLRQRRGLSAGETDAATRLERDIVDLVYRHLHDALRPQFLKRYGPLVDVRHASTRFTELLNEFFVKVLGRFPDALARLATARELRAYVSWAMTNLICDHLRRAQHERSGDEELLGHLVPRHVLELGLR